MSIDSLCGKISLEHTSMSVISMKWMCFATYSSCFCSSVTQRPGSVSEVLMRRRMEPGLYSGTGSFAETSTLEQAARAAMNVVERISEMLNVIRSVSYKIQWFTSRHWGVLPASFNSLEKSPSHDRQQRPAPSSYHSQFRAHTYTVVQSTFPPLCHI